MHSKLSKYEKPMCAEAIEALAECHAAHPYRKFVGACNAQKKALGECFGAMV